MPVPSSVKNLLDTQNVRYNVANLTLRDLEWTLDAPAGSAPRTTVRSLILKDGLGKVQVLYPGDCLLDLNALNQLMVRQLRASSFEDLRAFYEKHQLESVPALPQLSGFATVVDERLLKAPSLLLDSGTCDQLLEVDQADFQRMLGECQHGSFSVPIASLQGEADVDDESQIATAVRSFTTLRIRQRLEETLELPPLPNTAQRIISLRVDPNADINDLANVVETDPSLAAQVVSWAASPYYSAPGKIKSIHDAIVRVLGFDMVLNLALGLALGRSLNLPKDVPNGVTPYWQQAVYTAATVEGLVTAIPREARPSFGMAYLSGLLNNFGFLVLAEVFPPHFEMINRYIEANPHVSVSAIERHVLGVTRNQLASWLMRIWHMPEEVEVAIRQQDNPAYRGEQQAYAKLLYVANAKLRERNIGYGPSTEIPASVYADLKLDPEQADITISNIMDSSQELNVIAQQLAF